MSPQPTSIRKAWFEWRKRSLPCSLNLKPELVLTKAQADIALKLLDEAFTEVERVRR